MADGGNSYQKPGNFASLVSQYSFSQESENLSFISNNASSTQELDGPESDQIEPSSPIASFSGLTRKRKRDNNEASSLLEVNPWPNNSTDIGEICSLCQKIDFQKIFDIDPYILRPRSRWKDLLIAQLGNRIIASPKSTKMPTNNCPVCIMLHQLSKHWETKNDRRGKKDWQLRICSWEESCPWVDRSIPALTLRPYDVPCLLVTPDEKSKRPFELRRGSYWFCVPTNKSLTQTQHKAKEPLVSPHIIKPQVDLSLPKEWLQFCQREHGASCTSHIKQPRDMKLIDCKSRIFKVVPAPNNAQYAALSYVWGDIVNSQSDETIGGRHNQSISRTVQDAMIATKGLGLRYLWCDKYCIDQGNAAEKHDQIMHMDAIYEASQVTIIAAAGQDANAGLPGVGITPRNFQPVINVGNAKLVYSMTSPQDVIKQSKWFTRGWTLQEGSLPSRRLVFTEDQIYFECNVFHCQETVQINLPLLRRSRELQRCQTFGMFSGKAMPKTNLTSIAIPSMFSDEQAWIDIETHLGRLLNLIEEFSSRDLTKDDDSLMAFSGIMNHFAKANQYYDKLETPRLQSVVLDLMGIPFIPTKSGIPSTLSSFSLDGNKSTQESMNQPINNPSEIFILSLNWFHIWTPSSNLSLPRRRKWERGICPSWTWAAWAGEVSFLDKKTVIKTHVKNLSGEGRGVDHLETRRFEYIAKPLLECGNGSLLEPIDACKKFTQRGYLSHPQVLRLVTRVIRPGHHSQIRIGGVGNLTVETGKHRLDGNIYMSKIVNSTSFEKMWRDGKCDLVILQISTQISTQGGLTIMVVEHGPELAERVGLAWVHLTAGDRMQQATQDLQSEAKQSERWQSFLEDCTEERAIRIG
jgi:Heterokaryon incompatibility protein (HET)